MSASTIDIKAVLLAVLAALAIAAAIVLSAWPAGGGAAQGSGKAIASEPARAKVTATVVAEGASDHTTRAHLVLMRDGEKAAEADVAAMAPGADPSKGGVEFTVGEGTYTLSVDRAPYDYDGGAFGGDRAWHFKVDADGQVLIHEFLLKKRDPLEMSDAELDAAKAALAAAGIEYVEKKAGEPVWHDGWTETFSYPDVYSYPPDTPAYQSYDGTVFATQAEAQAHFESTGSGYQSTVIRGVPVLEEEGYDVTVSHPGYYEDTE